MSESSHRNIRKFWLMKSEPDVFSLEHLRAKDVSGWDGVRNYQARNFIKEMRPGDQFLFYHSNANPPGVAGIAEVVRAAYPDPTQFDRKSDHYDPKSLPQKPIWLQVDVRYVSTFKHFLSLDELRDIPALAGMLLFTHGRLSVQPVTEVQWRSILKHAN